jgi:hypothetical protein
MFGEFAIKSERFIKPFNSKMIMQDGARYRNS